MDQDERQRKLEAGRAKVCEIERYPSSLGYCYQRLHWNTIAVTLAEQPTRPLAITS